MRTTFLRFLRLLQDEKLDKLRSALREFHPFDVIGAAEREVRHTKTLTWLLDPAGSHGLGDLFLRAFLRSLKSHVNEEFWQACELDRMAPVRALSEYVPKLAQGRAKPKSAQRKANKDVRVDSVVHGTSWVLAIEAKVNSSENHDQLKKYRHALNDDPVLGSMKNKLLVYLTLEGDEPSDEPENGDAPWTSATWLDNVAEPLERLLQWRENGIADHALYFMRSYVDLIKRLSESGVSKIDALDEELVAEHRAFLSIPKSRLEDFSESAEARPIYETHRYLIERLRNKIVGEVAVRAKAIRQFLTAREGEFMQMGSGKSMTYIGFLPCSLSKIDGILIDGGSKATVVFDVVNRNNEPLHAILTFCNLGDVYKSEANWEMRRRAWRELQKTDGEPAAKYARAWRWPKKSTRDKSVPGYKNGGDQEVSEKVAEKYAEAWMKALFDGVIQGQAQEVYAAFQKALGSSASP